jgi:hypothetical protein
LVADRCSGWPWQHCNPNQDAPLGPMRAHRQDGTTRVHSQRAGRDAAEIRRRSP